MAPTLVSHASLVVLVALAACRGGGAPSTDPETAPGNGAVAGASAAGDVDVDPRAQELQAMAAAVFPPLPAEPVAGDNDLGPARVDLGPTLSFGARLSRNPEQQGGSRTLREVGCTTCHAGSVATLDEAITRMARHQLGKELTPAQVVSIATFLRALTGTVDSQYIARPELPASGPETPAPDPS